MSEENTNWHIKSSYLIFFIFLTFGISSYLWRIISPELFEDNSSFLSDVLYDYLWNMVLFLLLYNLAKKASMNWPSLLGKFKSEYISGRFILIVIPLIALSLGGIYLLFYPLSWWNPEYVNSLMTEDDVNLISLQGDYYKLANILNFLNVSIIVPVIEEILFRGLLLTSLALKGKVFKAVLISSFIFGLFHVDIIGSTMFGIVAAIIYIRTKSLFAPMILHSANNTLVLIILYLQTFFMDNNEYTMKDFQSYWWIGMICLIIGVSWFVYFYKYEISSRLLIVPYFGNNSK